MSKLMGMRSVRWMSYVISLCFLCVHIVMFWMFNKYGVAPMAGFNIFSICFYVAVFPIIKLEKMRLFAISVFLEVLAHMSLAVFFVGWLPGFQITLISINILIFFAEYLGKTLRYKTFRALPLAAASMIMYLVVFIINYYRPAPYSLPERVSFWLNIVWALLVFVLSITFQQFFVSLGVDSQRILSHQIIIDPLTGVYNRAGYDQALSETELKSLSMVLLDADHFKEINDTHGHDVGDAILQKIAGMLRKYFEENEYICRIGGDEFVVLLIHPASPDMASVREAIDRINTELQNPEETDSRIPPVSVSAGVACGINETDAQSLFSHADMALYQAKKDGRRCCCIYEQDIHS